MTSQPPPPASSQAPRRPKRRLVMWTALGVGLALLVVVLLLPTLASTGPGQRLLMQAVNARIPGTLTAQDVRLRWWGGQSIEGLTLRDPQGHLVAQITRIDAPETGLLPLALGSRNLGQIRIQADEIHLRQQPGQRTNLQQAVSRQPQPAQDQPADTQPLQLDQDTSLNLSFTARRITYEGPDIEPVELTNVNAQLDVPSLQAIAIKLTSDLLQAGQTGRIDLDGQLHNAFTQEGRLALETAMVNAQAELTNLPVPMADRLMDQQGRLAGLLGEQIDAHLTAQGPLDQLNAVITAQSPHLNIDAALTGTPDQLQVRPGSTLRMEVTPQAVAAFTAPSTPDQPPSTQPATQLAQPFTLELRVASLTIPRQQDQLILADATIDATATASDIILNVPDRGPMALRSTRLAINSADLSQQVQAQLDAQAQVENVTEPVQMRALVRNALGQEGPLAATLNLVKLPMPLADALAGGGDRLTQLLGRTLDATVSLTRDPEQAYAFEGQVRAPNLSAPFQGSYAADGLARLRTPSPAELTLTPAAFTQWVATAQPRRLELVQPMSIQANIADLQLAMRPADPDQPDQPLLARLDPQRTHLLADAAIPLAVFRDPATQRIARVEEGRFRVEGQDLSQLLNVLANLKLEAVTPQGQTQPGTVQSQTQIRGLITAAGQFQPRQAHISSQSSLESVPSILLDTLLGQDGQLEAVLGPQTSAQLAVDYRPDQGGQATFELDSTNASGHLPLLFTPDGVAQLRENAELSLQVTPALSQVVLSRINPFLAGAIAAQAPLKLTILKEGFALPIRGFDWRQVSGQARLDVGQINLLPQGFTGTLLQVISPLIRAPNLSSYLGQMQPVDLKMQQGRLSYDRMRIALQEIGIDLNFSGTVDLDTRNLDLQLLLGGPRLPIRELEQVAIPIQGTITQPRLNEQALAQAALEAGLRSGLQDLLRGQDGSRRLPPQLESIFGTPRQDESQAQEQDDQDQDQDQNQPQQRRQQRRQRRQSQ
ncbi:MAG TPA: hypothetical protein VF184_06480 [Phycisphaeraceae bacterium]